MTEDEERRANMDIWRILFTIDDPLDASSLLAMVVGQLIVRVSELDAEVRDAMIDTMDHNIRASVTAFEKLAEKERVRN